MQTQWNNLGPRVGVAWDPTGDGKTSVRASYGKSFEFVNAQFHLNTSVAPPWGSEVRLNQPLGGLDNPFLNTQGQTNIFPVTFDQNAPFSLNGPFLSLSNDMASTTSTCGTSPSSASCRDRGSRRPATSAAGPTTSGNPRRSTTPCSGTSARPRRARPTSTRAGRSRCQDPTNGQYYGPLDLYVTDGKQRYNGMLLSVRKSGARTTMSANYTLSHCYGSPDGFGGATTNVSSATTTRTIPASTTAIARRTGCRISR